MPRFALLCVLSVFLLHCSDDGGSGAGAQGGAGQGAGGKSGSSQGGSGKGGGAQAGSGGGSGTGGSSQAGGQGPAAGCDVDSTTHKGDGTYYGADGSGNCSFPATPDDLMVGAMNQTDYDSSASCGSCARVEGPDGVITVRIVDRCPECKPGDIDLSPEAFGKLATLEKGRIAISWRYVACPVQGNLVYHFKDGSNPWWTAVQIRNHRYPIARVEYKGKDGAYKPTERQEYNYFLASSGMGEGPFGFRVTDVLGNVIEDTNIPLGDDTDAPGKGQFPACQ